MPNPEDSDRNQKYLYWKRTGYDDYGSPTITSATPVELDGDWDWDETEVTDGERGTVGVVATLVTDRDLVNDSVIWLGTLEEYTAMTNKPSDLLQVLGAKKTWDLKGRHVRREISLKRRGDSLPSVV